LDEASSSIDLAQTRTNVMTRKLKSVEALSQSRVQALLPGAEVAVPDVAADVSDASEASGAEPGVSAPVRT
ncbi:MAG TPA: hypothetical protein VFG60_06355, partial [Burkholderiaceae bacterium]|nr:hypothetical protein [Burkholderiaceae bacterium]